MQIKYYNNGKPNSLLLEVFLQVLQFCLLLKIQIYFYM